MKKNNISFFLSVAFSLALLNVRVASVWQTEDLSSSQKSHRYSFLPLIPSSSEIENVSTYNFIGVPNVNGPKKFTNFSETKTALLTRHIAFTSPIRNAAGYLHIQKYLSHNHPSHNFW